MLWTVFIRCILHSKWKALRVACVSIQIAGMMPVLWLLIEKDVIQKEKLMGWEKEGKDNLGECF